MSSMECSHLPSEIIYEILLRASSDTIRCFRVASKEWNQITYDSKFRILHSQMNNVVDGFLSRYWSKDNSMARWSTNDEGDSFFFSIRDEIPDLSLDFVPGCGVSLEAVSANHGIILCTSDNPRDYYLPSFFVCKPRIKLFQRIPNPRTKFSTGVAICVIGSNPFRYKILRISSSKNQFTNIYETFICEVFDSETWTWKRLTDIMLPKHLLFMGRLPTLTVCGSIHWFIEPDLVFSFDVVKEEWKILESPVKRVDYDNIKLVEYEGKLALICMDSEGYVHTWVMENYKNQEWKKNFL